MLMREKSNLFANTLRQWLPLALVVTALAALVYLTVQQNFRMAANDPQIQLAEDVAEALNQGQAVQSVVPSNTDIDIAKSLAAFITVFDDEGKPVASSGRLDNRMPILPPGLFEHARTSGEERVTWQPRAGVRVATVIVHHNGARAGFVLAGRSLREVERRVANLNFMVLGAWFVSLVILAVLVSLLNIKFRLS